MNTIHQSNKRLHGVLFVALLGMLVFAACESHVGSSSQLKREVDSFAVYYFNWQYHKAVRFVSPESEKWVRYVASQVHQVDIDLLRQKEQPATCEILSIDYADNDSSAVAHVAINNFLRMDTIGRAASFVASADYDIPLVYDVENNRWKVLLQGALREKR
ncbi:MAG: hypothetical protein J5867_07175 [Prevotella sp.]|nr:hypothetical protein [Prevotella sp.]